MDEPRDMTGVLFKEQEKRSDRSPDYRGKLTIRGETFRLSGWVKEKNGKRFLSLAVRESTEGGARREDEDNVPC